MFESIKKFFGFDKKETATVPVNVPKEEAEKVLSEVVASYKEEVKFDEATGTVTIPVGNRTKEEAEKAFQERISEIEAKNTEAPAPKPKTTPKAAPKKPETKVDTKVKTKVETKAAPKAKPAPKKATKKAEK